MKTELFLLLLVQKKVENISYRVDHRILFDNISFATSSSGVTLITGKNGTGKSTLL
ncbi:ABC transporter ATP-binding protein [Streptococcus pneumoniae]|nr:ABC transporter ATP-binding protein [Streptococcus pneumoniae]